MQKEKLISTIEALKQGFAILSKNESLGFIVKIEIIAGIFTMALSIPLLIGWFVLGSFIGVSMGGVPSTSAMQTSSSSIAPAFPNFPGEHLAILVTILLWLVIVGTIYLVFYINLQLLTQLRLISGELGDIKTLVKTAIVKVPKMAILLSVQGFVVTLGYLFFIIPGIILGLKFMYSGYILLTTNCGPIESMHRSSTLTTGYKMSLFIKSVGLFCIHLFLLVPIGLLALSSGRTAVGGLIIYLYVIWLQLVRVIIYQDLVNIKNKTQSAVVHA